MASDMTSKSVLTEREERLYSAIKSSHLGVWNWDLITNELYWNAGCQRMHGFPADSVSTVDDFWAAVYPADRDRIQQHIEAACDPFGNGRYSVEYRTIHSPNAKQQWVLAQGQVSFSRNGIPLCLLGTVVDITQQKQTLSMCERQFRQEQAARQSIESENQIKDKFLAVLSHELRSPLNPILGWSRLLQTRKWDESTVTKALAIIEENARTQSQLIDDLLDIAKILHGKLSSKMTRVNLVPVIHAAINIVQSAAIAKSISIQLTIDNSAPEGDRPPLPDTQPPAMYVSGDAVRLQQVVWNLLSNAVKFTPEQGQVHIQLGRVGNQAQITVKDTGKGISPEVLPYLFQPFYQEEDMKRNHARQDGLGLGLMIVRQLVEHHGGTITADSAGEGCGAVFTARLPLLVDVPDDSNEDEEERLTPDLTGVRVLIVDEDPDNRELATIWLNQQGANVLAVSSTALVLPILRTFRPHVYVGEIGFSDANGFCFMQQLRALSQEQGGQIPAIALTAYAGESYRQRAFASGYHRYLVKPCESEQLVQAVSELSTCSNLR